jgi:hypothetical protein
MEETNLSSAASEFFASTATDIMVSLREEIRTRLLPDFEQERKKANSKRESRCSSGC